MSYRIAVIGVAVALGAFLIMAGIVLALGHQIPNEYWSAGSAVGGALLGILAPTPPNALSTAKRQAARAHQAAAKAHAAAAEKIVADAAAREQAGAPAAAQHASDPAGAQTAAQHASDEAALASSHAAAETSLTSYIPTALLLALFVISTIVWLAGPVTQLQAFAAASGTALLGILAPSPA